MAVQKVVVTAVRRDDSLAAKKVARMADDSGVHLVVHWANLWAAWKALQLVDWMVYCLAVSMEPMMVE